MKLLIITYGTEGDTRPLAALGHAVVRAGHEVELLGDASTLGVAQALGIPAQALAGDIRATIAADGAMRDITRNLARLTIEHSGDWLRQAIDAGRGCDAVIVSGLAAFVGLSAAEALRVPAIGAMLIPISPTSAFASPFLPFTPPRLFNRASHTLFGRLSWQLFRKATNAARAQAGLPPRRTLWTDHPMLYGVSPALVPRPTDWPDNAHVCGQWIPPLATTFAPPDDLRAFLDAGEPPVYVGFGSMAGFDNARLVDAVVGALGSRRTLFNAGWSGIDTTQLPANFHAIGHVPHDWLLPRCALAIHHGGSGTTHSTCRAGIPSVIVPFAGDQFFWNARLRDAGVMRHALKGASITASALRDAVAYASTDTAREHASILGHAMRHEDGCSTAVALVKRYAMPG
ncbi:glycosyltransferase [Pseudoxanthomonas sp. PXM02]|uniref:glycosyltransferase n=1 Tax=Pseudoxanthomonas sp. PXM02 TaxID=2769294 RepID=UPI00177AC67C|nr:glycosyltransferase [Pseudoxanthomonas sp. PXM02]MBD9480547.1 glycosyltransferase family 1 protein [Pseudoxanthomonas sp. PXM02]